MAHVAQWKKEVVSELEDLIKSGNTVALVAVNGIPAVQMQKMRENLRGKARIKVAKNKLIKLALQNASQERPGVEKLAEYIEHQQLALVSTDSNAFSFYKEIEKSKTKAPAKGGETAPEDIVVKAGPTSFKPGPIVGDFQRVGIPAAIEGGKIVIKKDKVMVKAGEKISRELAQMLAKLEIFPITVGMDVIAAYEDGTVFDKSVLAVDESEYLAKVQSASASAFNLAMYIGYVTDMTIEPLIAKAATEALNLAVNAAIPTSESIEALIAKAQREMLAIASLAPDALDDELKEALSSRPSQGPPPSEGGGEQEEKKEEEKEEEEEVSEEEAAAGLGALFG